MILPQINLALNLMRLINRENKQKPLSDAKMAAKLGTTEYKVCEHRRDLGIPDGRERKQTKWTTLRMKEGW